MGSYKKIRAIFFIVFTVAAGLALILFLKEYYSHFLRSESDLYIPDELAGHLHRPDAKKKFEWPEHPEKAITIRTNNLGFRENEETQINKDINCRRILITGDSHTDGVVNNHESYANILEGKLNEKDENIFFEVINGGTGYYTFENYFGFFKKHLFLKPDVFIIGIYPGNDFLETVKNDNRNYSVLWQIKRWWNRIKLRFLIDNVVSQAINQVVYFAEFPEMKEQALENAKAAINQINSLCHQHRVDLIVVFLPCKFDFEPHDELSKKFNLSKEETAINKTLVSSLNSRLEKNSITTINIMDSLDDGKNYFWQADHHLNTQGHALVAEFLFQYFLTPVSTPIY